MMVHASAPLPLSLMSINSLEWNKRRKEETFSGNSPSNDGGVGSFITICMKSVVSLVVQLLIFVDVYI